MTSIEWKARVHIAGRATIEPIHAAERCPRCRAAATYVGLERLECPTPECPSYGGEPGEQLWLDLPVRRVDQRPILPLG